MIRASITRRWSRSSNAPRKFDNVRASRVNARKFFIPAAFFGDWHASVVHSTNHSWWVVFLGRFTVALAGWKPSARPLAIMYKRVHEFNVECAFATLTKRQDQGAHQLRLSRGRHPL